MHVKIGPYNSWIGPYQIADMIFWWQEKYNDECKWAQRAHRLGHWLSEKSDGTESWLLKVCQWLELKRTRQVYVKIDKYDTWGMDHTLALIALPMLKQLQATKHGSPNVDDDDVPEHLKATAPTHNSRVLLDVEDSNHFLRWDWVIAEMIWAFEQKVDDGADSQFYDHGEDIPGEDFMDAVRRIKVDEPGLLAWQARKANGFRLFGKYYEALWD
jgi:hypothetical protein